MRWLGIILLGTLLLVMEQGLRNLLEIGGISPGFVLTLVVYAAILAPAAGSFWLAVCAGCVVDLTLTYHDAASGVDYALVGPTALAFLLARTVGLQMRGVIFRDSPVAVAVVVFVAGLLAQLALVMLLTARGLPFVTGQPIEGWNWADQLVQRFFGTLYSAVLAVPLTVLLSKLEPVLGLAGAATSRARRNRG